MGGLVKSSFTRGSLRARGSSRKTHRGCAGFRHPTKDTDPGFGILSSLMLQFSCKTCCIFPVLGMFFVFLVLFIFTGGLQVFRYHTKSRDGMVLGRYPRMRWFGVCPLTPPFGLRTPTRGSIPEKRFLEDMCFSKFHVHLPLSGQDFWLANCGSFESTRYVGAIPRSEHMGVPILIEVAPVGFQRDIHLYYRLRNCATESEHAHIDIYSPFTDPGCASLSFFFFPQWFFAHAKSCG